MTTSIPEGMVRVEARSNADDEDYLNAIVVPEDDADDVIRSWRGTYGHAAAVDEPSDEKSEPEPEDESPEDSEPDAEPETSRQFPTDPAAPSTPQSQE